MEFKTRFSKLLMPSKFIHCACTKWKSPLQKIHCFSYCPNINIWTEVFIFLFYFSSCQHRTWPLVSKSNHKKWVTFIISKPNIETRLMFLYQTVFKNESFNFVLNLHPFNCCCFRNHLLSSNREIFFQLEI